jgi:predicted dehydrogenase
MRGAVIGLGMMGRHHARILQNHPTLEFGGAVDPAGDVHGCVNDSARVHATINLMLASGARPDFAVVAVPTEEHLAAVKTLSAAGVHLLIEKPLAPTVSDSRQLIAAVDDAGVKAAVGHVERFNPALLELRRRINDGQLGEVFLIATERVGPFPDRVKDVGVVKDLATHDLDLVRWLGGAAVDRLSAETQHRMGREHEDLVLAHGRLENGRTFQCSVDWLTPTKVRQTRVLGERGMLVANTLTADLTFYENAEVSTSGWSAIQALRGVAEGDMTRYALERREPLAVELETFAAYCAGDESAAVVSLADGLQTVAVAEACLTSAANGETVRP